MMGAKFKIPTIVTVAGAMFGYLILSPFAMYITHNVHMECPIHEMDLIEVFGTELLSWSMPFTLLGGLIGLGVGLLFQRVREKTTEIKKEKDYTDLLLNSMKEGMLTIDLDYTRLRANRAFLG